MQLPVMVETILTMTRQEIIFLTRLPEKDLSLATLDEAGRAHLQGLLHHIMLCVLIRYWYSFNESALFEMY